MIDKMHLRKYMLRTVLRSDARSRITRSLHRSPLSHEFTLSSRNNDGGYVLRYILSPLSSSSPTPTPVLPRPSYTPACIRTFGTTVSQSTVCDIDHRLASLYDDMKHEQVPAHRLQEVIKLYDDSNRQIDSNTSMLLLRACANLSIDANAKERQDFVDRAWHLASQSGSSLTLEHYNTLLDVHAQNANPVDFRKFLADMSVEPDAKTYHLLLNIAARTGDIGNLKDIMSMIKNKNIALDEEAFATVVQTYAASGNITEAEHMITLAKDTKVSTNKLYTELACGYAMLGDIPNLVKILNDEPQSDTSLLRIIVALSKSNNGKHIPVVLNFLTASIPSAFDSEISKTIKELMRANRIVDAHTIINCLGLNKATTSFTKSLVSGFLNNLIIMDMPIEDVTKYASDFVDSGCDPLALSDVAELGLKLGRENLCLATFAAMKQRGIELRPHYYWPLLVMAQNQDESKIFSLIKSMMAAGVGLDHDTLTNYVFPYVNTANPITTLQKMKTERIPRIILHTPMVVFLLNNNRLQDVVALCEYSHMKLYYPDLLRPLVRVYLSTQDIENCAKILTIFPAGHEFVSVFLLHLINNMDSSSNMENMQFLLKTFKSHNVTISLYDANLLKDRLGKFKFHINRNWNILDLIDSMIDTKIQRTVSLITHRKYIDSKQLECHLVELKNKNMPVNTVLRRLLEVYCNENNLFKAEELKHKYNANEYKWTPGMKIYLFELYLKHDKLNEAEILLTELQNESDGFLIDSYKILMFATALIKDNRPKSAFDVIQNTKFIKIRNTQRDCIRLLYVLAQSEYHSYTQDLLWILLNKGYCKMSINLLRPLVAIPLKLNDIPSAVNIFSECVQKYKMIPLAQELFTALLRERDNESSLDINRYIERVYNDVVSVKDFETVTTFLMIGLATLDKTDELQTILQNQKFSMSTLIHYFDFAQRNNKLDIFHKILKMSNLDSNNLDHDILCNLLLSTYCRISDCDNALELWKIMCAKNIKPNRQFIKNFIHFLQSHKVPLPPEFEEKSGMYVRNK